MGQAFLYNAFFFTYGDTLTTFLDVKQTGWYLAIFAVSNFAGALLLSKLFDTVGRIRMISGTYILSGVPLAGTGTLLGSVTAVTLTLMGAIVFFFASAGASAAYLTASDVFPMETRALCIAFFCAIGTAAGGISGAVILRLAHSIVPPRAATSPRSRPADFVGAALMIVGGVIQAHLGAKAEAGRSRASPDPSRPTTPSPPRPDRRLAICVPWVHDGRGDPSGPGSPRGRRGAGAPRHQAA